MDMSETIPSSWASALSERRHDNQLQGSTGSAFQLASPSDLAAMMSYTEQCKKDVQIATHESQELRRLLLEERSLRQQAEVDKASVLQVLRESGIDLTTQQTRESPAGDSSAVDLATQAGTPSLRKLLQGCHGERAREFLAAEVTQLGGKELVDLVQEMVQKLQLLRCNEVDIRDRLRTLTVECEGLREANEGLAALAAVKQALVKERLKNDQLQRSLKKGHLFGTKTIAESKPPSAAGRLELEPTHPAPTDRWTSSLEESSFLDTVEDAAASMFKGRSTFLDGDSGSPCNFQFKRDTPLIGMYTILPLISEGKNKGTKKEL
ncbi:hypothetical protein BSKO_07355 [Bryopsis sp. KO-2023]|nr:hypothetical protein BSKO_07355 [Bryopsis sp. KO-2023]